MLIRVMLYCMFDFSMHLQACLEDKLNFSLRVQMQHRLINMQARVISLCGSASLNNSLSSVAVGINEPDRAD